jgi:hypothetical protein
MTIQEIMRNPLFKIVMALLAIFLIIKIIKAALSIIWVVAIVVLVLYIVSDEVRTLVNGFFRRIFK